MRVELSEESATKYDDSLLRIPTNATGHMWLPSREDSKPGSELGFTENQRHSNSADDFVSTRLLDLFLHQRPTCIILPSV